MENNLKMLMLSTLEIINFLKDEFVDNPIKDNVLIKNSYSIIKKGL